MSQTLLVLAAWLGSRFGWLKQLQSVWPSGEFIIDYSIYDAIKAWFQRVIFVIKEENLTDFKQTIGSRLAWKITVDYAFQKLDDLPTWITCPPTRTKPRGTWHAILSARHLINWPFGVITADDFYGRDAFFQLANRLKNDTWTPEYSLIGYKIKNTMSKNWTVKRWICEAKSWYLIKLWDAVISIQNGIITATPINGQPSFSIWPDHLTSMLMFGFNQTVFPLTESSFINFLLAHKENLDTVEYIHSDALWKEIESWNCKIKVIPTDAIRHGMTYQADKPEVENAILELIKDGIYPKSLRK